jgi:hypothetical protein
MHTCEQNFTDWFLILGNGSIIQWILSIHNYNFCLFYAQIIKTLHFDHVFPKILQHFINFFVEGSMIYPFQMFITLYSFFPRRPPPVEKQRLFIVYDPVWSF